jgi:thiamine biosynthesis protein ThiI
MSELILIRLAGEISIKARATRRHFAGRLVSNLRDALQAEAIPARIRVAHDRISAEVEEKDGAAAQAVISRVFGVQTTSRALRRSCASEADVAREGYALFREAVAGKRFAVRVRRLGGRAAVGLAPSQIERALGAELLRHAARVDLDDPEVWCRIELHPDQADFFVDRSPGPGGLPLGVEGRAIALISGGFDSAVAAWQMLRRGVALDYVFCKLGGRAHEQGVLRVAEQLALRWSYGTQPKLHSIDFSELADELRAKTEKRFWQVLLKRQMLRAAERVARARRAPALVTGDALGQVSSQTLRNLAVVGRATELALLRPLLGANKDEIIRASEEIGTFELSKVVGEYCAMVPKRPATAARLGDIDLQESRLDPELLEAAVAARRILDLRALDPRELALAGVDLERIPEGAIAIDLRTKAEWEQWHAPDALHLEFALAQQAWPSFDRSKRYVLYCEIGLKSAHLAEQMRGAGFDAYHIRGGLRTLRRAAAATAGGSEHEPRID